MIRTVVEEADDLLLSACDGTTGYAFKGNKGTFILARDTEGYYIWVRLTPGKVTKPKNTYSTIHNAIEEKMDEGYSVFAFDDAELY